MKILVDMNLTPDWCPLLNRSGHQAVHWSEVGDPRAADHKIMKWATINGYVVFTHDLDFGAILAMTQAEAPSVIQVRTEDVMPDHLGQTVVSVLSEHETSLKEGAIIVIDKHRLRVRILPLRQ